MLFKGQVYLFYKAHRKLLPTRFHSCFQLERVLTPPNPKAEPHPSREIFKPLKIRKTYSEKITKYCKKFLLESLDNIITDEC